MNRAASLFVTLLALAGGSGLYGCSYMPCREVTSIETHLADAQPARQPIQSRQYILID